MENRFKPSGSGVRRTLAAIGCALRGLRDAFRFETAFRQELAAIAILVPVALWLPFSVVERLLLIGSLGLVLIVELLNSAIETVVDRISVERHELSRRAKDIGSAAVLLSLALAAITWGALLWPQLRHVLGLV